MNRAVTFLLAGVLSACTPALTPQDAVLAPKTEATHRLEHYGPDFDYYFTPHVKQEEVRLNVVSEGKPVGVIYMAVGKQIGREVECERLENPLEIDNTFYHSIDCRLGTLEAGERVNLLFSGNKPSVTPYFLVKGALKTLQPAFIDPP